VVRFTTGTNKTEGGSWLVARLRSFLAENARRKLEHSLTVNTCQHASFVRTRILYDVFVVEFCIFILSLAATRHNVTASFRHCRILSCSLHI